MSEADTGSNVSEFAISRRRALGLTALGVLYFQLKPVIAAVAPWPDHSVSMIVPYPPGGSSDILARLVADQLLHSLGQPFVTENIGGASGALGSQRVARAAPDGYTLLVADVGSHVIAPLISANGIQTMRDFTHIAMLGGSPFAMVVNPSIPVHDLQSLMTYVKAQPNGINWTSSGVGSRGHLLGEMFKAQNHLNMVHVAYKGAIPAVTDVLANHLPMAFVTLSAVGEMIKAKQLRGIGVTSQKRLENYPDVPTMAEQNYSSMTTLSAFMLAGPKGISSDIVEKLNAAVRTAVDSVELRNQYAKLDLVSDDMSPDELRSFLIKEKDFYQPIVASLALGK